MSVDIAGTKKRKKRHNTQVRHKDISLLSRCHLQIHVNSSCTLLHTVQKVLKVDGLVLAQQDIEAEI